MGGPDPPIPRINLFVKPVSVMIFQDVRAALLAKGMKPEILL
jgi:hypothetical protein